MTQPFGALTDHYGLASASLVLVDSSKTPIAQSRADAPDEKNDVAASAYYGNTAAALFDISCTYALKSGSLDLQTILLGELSVGLLALGLDVDTSGGGWPQIKIPGKLGTSAITAPNGYLNKFALPASITILGSKIAQPIGFTVGAGKLTSSKLSCKIESPQQNDGVGEPAAFGLSGGTGSVTADFVRITDPVAWTITAGWLTLIKAPASGEEKQAAWHTTSAEAGFTLSRQAAS